MPLSFSFFSQRRAEPAENQAVAAVPGNENVVKEEAILQAPLSGNSLNGSLLNAYAQAGAAVMPRPPTVPAVADLEAGAGKFVPPTLHSFFEQAHAMPPLPLAALSANQTVTPPRALTTGSVHRPFPIPGPAIAANLAQAAHEDTEAVPAEEASPLKEEVVLPPPSPPSAAAPAAIPEWHGHLPQRNHALDDLRDEVMAEIDQVKSDLFGAVMGVSALKDRLDGMEGDIAQINTQKSAGPTRQELQDWMQGWIESQLERIIEQAVTKALEGTVIPVYDQDRAGNFSRLSGWGAALPLNDPGALFCQPPVILSTSLS